MPTRLLREGIITSEKVDRLSLGGEVFYRRLMSVVDDFGRYFANARLLKSGCYPLRDVTLAEITTWLNECIETKLIKIHKTKKGDVVEIIEFKQQVRAKKSKYPLDSEK